MTTRERRRLARARAFWTFLAAAFTIAAAVAFGMGRAGLGIALVIGVTISLGGLARAGRARPPARR